MVGRDLSQPLERDVTGLIITREPDLTNLRRLLGALNEACVEATVGDNASSSRVDIEQLCTDHGVTFASSDRNLGLPHHLNAAVQSTSATWMLYLDQDSSITADQVRALTQAAAQQPAETALVSPQYRQLSTGALGYSDRNLGRATRTPIGSGSVYRTSACRKVGGFDERLPLDQCDFAMALALQTAGHRVIVDESIVVDHQVGNRTPSRIARAGPGNHDSWRYYTKSAGLRHVAAKHWRTHPGWVTRNVLGRIIETVRSAWSSRNPQILSQAARGLLLLPSKAVPGDLLDAIRRK